MVSIGLLVRLDDARGAVGDGQGLAAQVHGGDDGAALRVQHLQVDLAFAELIDGQFDEHADLGPDAGEPAADLGDAYDLAGAGAEGFVDFRVNVGHEEELQSNTEDGDGERDAAQVEEAQFEPDAHASPSRRT